MKTKKSQSVLVVVFSWINKWNWPLAYQDGDLNVKLKFSIVWGQNMLHEDQKALVYITSFLDPMYKTGFPTREYSIQSELYVVK